MKAIALTSFGGPEVLEYVSLPDPELRDSSVLVSVEAAGVNFIDTYQRQGKYPVEFPFVPGFEGAGTVLAVGAGVNEIQSGDRVAWPWVLNSYAERVVVPAESLVSVPDFVSTQAAAAVMLQGLTAHYLTHDSFAIQPETTALVHAGAGGTGQMLTQVIRALGGSVISTVSSAAKAESAQAAGAHHVVRYDTEDFVAAVDRLTDGAGVQVIYDGVGQDTMSKGLHALARRGTMVYFGASSGPADPLDLQVLSSNGSLTITKPTLADFITTHKETQYRADSIFALIRDGALTPRVGATYALEDAANAHRDLESRSTTGKLLLIP
jgi:NADPH2:quinone reductase